MGTLKAFIYGRIITIKESVKLMLLTIFLFLLIGVPLAYIFYTLNVSVKIAGTITGIVVAIAVIVIDCKKLHCMYKINIQVRDI
jgi:membrane associated rhomboid family serine protease